MDATRSRRPKGRVVASRYAATARRAPPRRKRADGAAAAPPPPTPSLTRVGGAGDPAAVPAVASARVERRRRRSSASAASAGAGSATAADVGTAGVAGRGETQDDASRMSLADLRALHDLSTNAVVAWRLANARQIVAFEGEDRAAAARLYAAWNRNRERRLALEKRKVELERRRKLAEMSAVVDQQYEATAGLSESIKTARSCLEPVTGALRAAADWLPAHRVAKVNVAALATALARAGAPLERAAPVVRENLEGVKMTAAMLDELSSLLDSTEAEIIASSSDLRRTKERETLERSLRIHLMQCQGLA